MTAIRESIKHDLRKDPKDLEHEADRARARVEHTLEALERRFSPGEMLDQAVRMIKHNGGELGSNFATQVRNNPLPALLAGAGITWLMASSGRAPQPQGSAHGADARSAIGDRASSAAASARGAAGTAKGAAQDAADATRSSAERIAHGSRSSAQRIRAGYAYMSREQPLILGALAVAAGAAIGALLPESEVEDQLMGETSDDAMARIEEEGLRKAEDAKTAAADAAETA